MPKVTNFSVGVNVYYPGDIIDIPESLYSSGFMEIISEPKPIEVVALPIFTEDLKTESLPPKPEKTKPKLERIQP